MTLDQLVDDLETRRTTSAELVETALSKAKTAPHVFFTLLEGESRAAARESDARRAAGNPLGPLDGIPIGWKDLIDVAGTRTTAGSIIRVDAPIATVDAPVVAATRKLGLIPLGKTHLNEFAFAAIGYNPHFGTPYAGRRGGELRAPGGSSAGSAIAVERGIVPVAIGTDTGGSVRIPAAFNGIVGYKSSQARYSLDGVFPLGKSLDSLGPLANSVRDCAWADAAMRGIAAPAVRPTRPSGIIFDTAILDEPGIDDAVRANTLAFADRLRAAGVPVEMREFAAFAETRRTIAELGWLLGFEAYALHKDTIAAHADEMDPRVVARLRKAALYPDENFRKLLEIRPRLIADAQRELGETLFFSPTVKHVAPLLQPVVEDMDLFRVTNLATLALTTPGSYLDMPGISIPSGTDADGHPTGVLLSTCSGCDDAILAGALWVEQRV